MYLLNLFTLANCEGNEYPLEQSEKITNNTKNMFFQRNSPAFAAQVVLITREYAWRRHRDRGQCGQLLSGTSPLKTTSVSATDASTSFRSRVLSDFRSGRHVRRVVSGRRFGTGMGRAAPGQLESTAGRQRRASTRGDAWRSSEKRHGLGGAFGQQQQASARHDSLCFVFN